MMRKKCSTKTCVAAGLSVALLIREDILSDKSIIQLMKSGRNFFFLETAGSTCLNGRQLCSIESAARQNPEFTVFLLTLRGTEGCRNLDYLKRLPNFRLGRIDVESLMNGTLLNGWYHGYSRIVSPFRVEHLSDALRILVLWKYGGVYADLDVLVLKSVADLQNSLSRELFPDIGSSMMVFRKGHPFLLACLQEFANTYNPWKWGHNGPVLLNRVSKRWCPKQQLKVLPHAFCADFSILPGEAFYPVSYMDWELPFKASTSDYVMTLLSNSYAFHFWNAVSKHTKIEKGSAYDVLQMNFCPTTYVHFDFTEQ